jgi:excisionase family DNA binding protein
MRQATNEGAERTERPLLATINEATEQLRLSRSLLYEAINRGQVEVRRFGKSVRIPWTEIERLAREGFSPSGDNAIR